MPVLRNGQLQNESSWLRLEDDSPYPDSMPVDTPTLVSLPRFLALQSQSINNVSGVYLKPEDDVRQLAEHHHRLAFIVIDFPKYTDGRGYSQARMLRKQLHFEGELRASGDIRPDQLLFMARAGIDTFEFSDTPDENQIKQIFSRFKVNYQPSYALPVVG